MNSTHVFDCLVFIGRFQPFHLGHQHVVHQALLHARRVLILVGSANLPRTPKNPFDAKERISMIVGSFCAEKQKRIDCQPLNDAPYNDHQWLINVQNIILQNTQPNEKIGIIGHSKDESSYYLSLFPQYRSFWVENYQGLSATPIRQAYFEDKNHWQTAKQHLTQASQNFLTLFKNSQEFIHLQQEFQHIQVYQKAWQNSPYPPSFITADALVVQSGHVLLIERAGEYGRGLYALPGGFVDNAEDFLAAAIRELYEETTLTFPKTKLINCLVNQCLFDDPKRSQRGRTVSMVYYFELPPDSDLPKLQASDDALRAFWLPLGQLDARKMFEDHYGIICKMLNI